MEAGEMKRHINKKILLNRTKVTPGSWIKSFLIFYLPICGIILICIAGFLIQLANHIPQ